MEELTEFFNAWQGPGIKLPLSKEHLWAEPRLMLGAVANCLPAEWVHRSEQQDHVPLHNATRVGMQK